jgi:hypothetical protein
VSVAAGTTPPTQVVVAVQLQGEAGVVQVPTEDIAEASALLVNSMKAKTSIPTESKTFLKVNFISFYIPPWRDKLIINNNK